MKEFSEIIGVISKNQIEVCNCWTRGREVKFVEVDKLRRPLMNLQEQFKIQTNRKRAKWIRCPELDDIYYSYCHCSNCGFVANKKHDYCVCGAVMED